VEQKLDVSVRKDTYAFDISYQSGDPQRAAAVANMAAQIFIEHSTEAYRSEAARAREFIEARLDESQKELDKARAAVQSFKNSGGTFDLTSEYNEKLKNVSDLQNTLAKAGGKLAGVKRAYRPDSPEVLGQESENAALQQQISTFQAQLVDYPAKEARLNADTLALRLAEESYEFFRKRYEEARVKESAIVTEIRIVSPAEPALYPSKPLKYMYGGVSFATALVVAIGWALFAEQLTPRVRTVRDLEDEPGVPVLGAIPTLRLFS
jgi:tyrosine-protein kinase Etk/Wzc